MHVQTTKRMFGLCTAACRGLGGGLVDSHRPVVRCNPCCTCCVGLGVDQTSLDIPVARAKTEVTLHHTDKFIICSHLASVKKASSTPSLIFAEVSINLMPSSFASSRPCSSVTAFLSVQSDLLPMRILLTPSEACCSMLACQTRISDKVNIKMTVPQQGRGKGQGVRNALLKDRSSVTS